MIDEKKSFVEQVSEGLLKKVPSDRFERIEEDEEVAPVRAEEVKEEEDPAENLGKKVESPEPA